MESRLKSLELHGYKTFASRTIFEFPADITAIVGPNGSGKSNISDAIRWVLGEQSYSLLRGRKTEDMIFAGSDQRSRASMASAMITFDNQDGWLPIDFTEVSIMRRAYRDGQNEYLLNGQRVRLKEITELLSKSGLAERTYTIIGQGLVDSALSLKPEERRRFFEEAAGIGLYRGRREDALNRLEATRRNLERVSDILNELEPRMISLEKQARRVQESQRIKADLKLLLREWYGYHFHLAQEELSHSKEVEHIQETRLQQARQVFETCEIQVSEQRVRLSDLRNKLNNFHSQMAELHLNHEQASRSLAVMDERRRAVLDQQRNLQNDIGGLESLQQEAMDRLGALTEERDWLQKELVESQEQAKLARTNLLIRQSNREILERKRIEFRRQLVSAETHQVELRAHNTELAARFEALQKTRQSLVAGMSEGEKTIVLAKDRLEGVSERMRIAKEDVETLEEEIQGARSHLSVIEANKRVNQEENSRLNSDKVRFSTQLEVLEQAEKSFSGLNQGARYILQESRLGHLPGKFSALSHFLEVPVEYEMAIAALLGDYLDGILVEDSDDLENALVLMGKGEKGRVILIPLQVDKAVEIAIPEDPDCIGAATKIVKYSDKLRPLISLLLGQVVIMRDRSSARRIAARLPTTARAVSLTGEVFWGNGVVVAGRDGRSGMIGRPRQKRELLGSLQEVEAKLITSSETLREHESILTKQRILLQDMEKQIRLANQTVNKESQQYQQAHLDLERSQQKFDWQRNQLSGVDSETGITKEELKKILTDIDKTSEAIIVLNGQMREVNGGLADLPLEDLTNQVGHWNTNAAVSERALIDADRRLNEQNKNIADNDRQAQNIHLRLQNVNLSLDQLEIGRTTNREQESILKAGIIDLQKQIEPAEDELKVVELEFSRLQENLTAAQQAVSVADRYATHAQLELTRKRDTLESLRKRIEEDFGLVVFEYARDVDGPNPLPLEGMTEQLPVVKEIAPEIEDGINRQRTLLRRLGAINPEAQSEYQSVRERFEFLTTQVQDLKKADTDLRNVITELDEMMRREFRKTFDAVAVEFRQLFTRLFGGGSAHLTLTDAEDPTMTGIDIDTRLPGRREQGLSLLSGGERSLTAVALIFALLRVSPTPFCVLDEVDAMLDESNVGRFCELLCELSQNTQFIVITHNRNTVQKAGVIYGVTMSRESSSQIISLKLDDVVDEMAR